MTLQMALDTLEASGLVRMIQLDSDIEYMFRHALVQDAAYDSLLKQDRRQLHLRVGETLERLYTEQLAEYAPVLAQHFQQAGEAERAYRYFVLAGDYASQRYANVEAVALYTEALVLAERVKSEPAECIRLFLARGRALELQALYRQALENYVSLENMGQQHADLGMELAALLPQATLRSTFNPAQDVALAQTLCDRALVLARQLNDHQAEAKTFWNLMLIHTYSTSPQIVDHPNKAIAYGQQALALTRRYNLREVQAIVLNDLHLSYRSLGQIDQALAMLLEAQAMWRETSNLPLLAENLNATGNIYLYSGQIDQALIYFEESFRIGQRIHDLASELRARFTLGTIHLLAGRFDQALALYQGGFRMDSTSGVVRLVLNLGLMLIWNYELLGAPALGLAQLEQMRLLARHAPPTFHITADLLSMQARIEVQMGAIEAAAETIKRAIAAEARYGAVDQASVVIARRAVLLAQGRYSELVVLMEHWTDGFSPILHQLFDDGAFYYQGVALYHLGKLDAAAVALDWAIAAARRKQAPVTLWPVLVAQADVKHAMHHPHKAAKLWREAQAIVRVLATQISDPALRSSFLAQPDVARLLQSSSDH